MRRSSPPSSRSLRILAVSETDGDARDSSPFGPLTLLLSHFGDESARPRRKRTALKLGYIEQLYTFGDRGRQRLPGEEGKHMVSVGYLALTRTDTENTERLAEAGAHWRDWYGYLPWEDWRQGRPPSSISRSCPGCPLWSLRHRRRPGRTDARSGHASALPFGLDDFPLGRGAGAGALRAALRGRSRARSGGSTAQAGSGRR